MKRFALVLALVLALSGWAAAQFGGSAVYNRGRGVGREAAEESERAKRALTTGEPAPSANSVNIDASVLINVKADEYVALFGLSEEAATVQEASAKLQGVVDQLTKGFGDAGLPTAGLYVDFVSQNRVYGFDVRDNLARERLTGFEVKKNVALPLKTRAQVDRCIAVASELGVYDPVKVDYVVRDTANVQSKLLEEAVKVVKRKMASYERLLGVQLAPASQVVAERHSAYYPTEMYDSYVAFESEDVNTPIDRGRMVVQGARKSRTFYFNPLSGRGFDSILSPVVTEPVVQFTLYFKVRAERLPVGAKTTSPGTSKKSPAKKKAR